MIAGRLDEIATLGAGLQPPVVAVIGEVVALRDQLDWFQRAAALTPESAPLLET